MFPQNKKIAWIFLLGLMYGALGEIVLFIHQQCRQLDAMLMDDFRIVTFLAADQPDSKAKVLEEKIRAVPGVRDVRYVSRESALAFLQEQDPDLMRSVALLGENPLHAGFEIRLTPEAISKMPGWLGALGELHDLGELQYKPLELSAITQINFYNRFLGVGVSLALLIWGVGTCASLWTALVRPETRKTPSEWGRLLMPGVLGVLAGVGVIFLAALPLKPISQLWTWPGWQRQALLTLVGMVGAGLLPELHGTGRQKERHSMSSHTWIKEEPAQPAEGPVGVKW